MMRQIVRRLTLTLLAIGLASPALAVDGVIEINQTCAVNTGCFSGDTAGFPVTIGTTGSYRLTGNLVVSDADTTAIQIVEQNVALDLNGFSIIGPAVCSSFTFGPVTACTPTGTGEGVRASGANTTITNGTVSGMGSNGIAIQGLATDGALVERVHAASNGGHGIRVDRHTRVTGSTATTNGFTGIYCNTGACTLTHNIVARNGQRGIFTGAGSTVTGNTAESNGLEGFFVLNGSTISNNVSNGNTGDGIATGSACVVTGNAVRSNTGFGLDLSFETGFANNSINSNTAGTVTGGVAMGTNICNGNTTCP